MLAILNGALVQIIVSARVLYGMADRKLLPQFFAKVNTWTNTRPKYIHDQSCSDAVGPVI